MKAGALIELLQQVDPDVEVLIHVGELNDLEPVGFVRTKLLHHSPVGGWYEHYGPKWAHLNDTPAAIITCIYDGDD